MTQPTLRDTRLAPWIAFLRGHAALTRAMSQRLIAEHGLTLNDYEVLLRLGAAPDRRMRRVDLSNSVFLTASGITRLLDGLECSGYVAKARCDGDARVIYAVLTDAGADLLRSAGRTHRSDIDALFLDRFSTDEGAALAELLERLPANPGDSIDDAACDA